MQIENALQTNYNNNISNTAEAMMNHYLCRSNQALFRATHQMYMKSAEEFYRMPS